jgi:hypothetical protein
MDSIYEDQINMKKTFFLIVPLLFLILSVDIYANNG